MNDVQFAQFTQTLTQTVKSRPFWRDSAFRTALILFLIVRIITLIIGVAANPSGLSRTFDPVEEPILAIVDQVITVPEPIRTVIMPWYRWDTGWYIYIAYKGYAPDYPTIVFGPLYPAAIRVGSLLTGGDYLLSALLINAVSCVVALTMLYKLTAAALPKRSLAEQQGIARTALLLFILFPSAFYMMAAYTEPLYLALALSAWYAVQHKRYLWAALFALLAALTRSQAWVLGLSFAYIIFIDGRSLPFRPWVWPGSILRYLWDSLRESAATRVRLIRQILAVIAPVLGAAIFLIGFPAIGLGDTNAALARPPWNTQLALPWQTVWNTLEVIIARPLAPIEVANLVCFGCLILFSIVVTVQMKPQYAIYCWVTLLLILLRNFDNFILHAMFRYVLHFFPVFVVAAVLLSRLRRIRGMLLIGYVLIGLVLQGLLIALFVRWTWIS